MSNTLEHAKDETWVVFTMTHDDDLFDADTGLPIDDCEYDEWSIGFNATIDDEYFARSARVVADNLTWSVANYIADLHNAHLHRKAQA